MEPTVVAVRHQSFTPEQERWAEQMGQAWEKVISISDQKSEIRMRRRCLNNKLEPPPRQVCGDLSGIQWQFGPRFDEWVAGAG